MIPFERVFSSALKSCTCVVSPDFHVRRGREGGKREGGKEERSKEKGGKEKRIKQNKRE